VPDQPMERAVAAVPSSGRPNQLRQQRRIPIHPAMGYPRGRTVKLPRCYEACGTFAVASWNIVT
jgi:hypothetical protein